MRTVVDIYSFELVKSDNTRVSSNFGQREKQTRLTANFSALGKTHEISVVGEKIIAKIKFHSVQNSNNFYLWK